MSKPIRILLIILGVLLALLLVGPFLVPVRPLPDTLPVKALADPDSRFVQVKGIWVHYKRYGQGEPVFVLLHGFAASLFSWQQVAEPLGEIGTVIAFDRPAFGLTQRPMRNEWGDENPYTQAFQVELTAGLMDDLEVERAILVGNSAGGTVSALFALAYPKRVQALILVNPAIYAGGGTPTFLRPLFNTPQMRHLGPLLARAIRNWGLDFAESAWHDPTRITPEMWEGYTRPLQAENWDRALWEFTAASRSPGVDLRLDELTMPTLVLAGDDDRIVPTQQSIRLAGELPNAELAVVPNCGHVPQEECPDAFMAAVRAFVAP